MAGRTPHEAVEAFLDPLRRAVSCVTREVMVLSPRGRESGRVHAAALADGLPVPLQGCGLSLYAVLHYEIVEADDERGPWKVATQAYAYSLQSAEGQEVLTYHWQPDGLGPDWPHLHIGTPVLRAGAPLDRKKHLPTGRIALEDVISLAIELGAEPLRPDHIEVLAASRDVFHRWRTWA